MRRNKMRQVYFNWYFQVELIQVFSIKAKEFFVRFQFLWLKFAFISWCLFYFLTCCFSNSTQYLALAIQDWHFLRTIHFQINIKQLNHTVICLILRSGYIYCRTKPKFVSQILKLTFSFYQVLKTKIIILFARAMKWF